MQRDILASMNIKLLCINFIRRTKYFHLVRVQSETKLFLAINLKESNELIKASQNFDNWNFL